MKLRLKSVHLVNFRAHADYTFEPDETGVTAIIGRNGSGKSSIIDGIAWALYGTKPNTGIKNSSWRRTGAPDDENTYVDVTFDFDGQELRVKRTLIGPKASSVTCECWLDGVLQAGPAVSHASRWIVNMLQLDEEGFLSTMLVQQKHVGQLVSASRAERRRILERLTGITAISSALEKAKDEEKVTKRAVASSDVDDSRIPVLEKQVKSAIKRKESTTAKIEKATREIHAVNTQGKALSEKLGKAQDELERRGEIESKMDSINSFLDGINEQRDDLLKRRDELNAELPKVKLDSSIIDETRSQLDDESNRLTELMSKRTSLMGSIESCPNEVDLKNASDEMERLQGEFGKYDVGSMNAELERIRVDIASADADIQRSMKSLGEIGDGVATCPTCLQPIKDTNHLKDELNGIIKTANERKSSLVSMRDDVMNGLRDVESLRSSLESARTEVDRIKGLRDGLPALRSQLVGLNGEVESLRGHVATLQHTVNRFDADNVKYNEYERTLSRLSEIIEKTNNAKSSLKSYGDELASITVDKESVDKLSSELKAKRDERDALNLSLTEMRGDLRLAETEEESASRELGTLREMVERHRSQLESYEISSTVSSLLGKFREHVILSSIPGVTDYASELIESVSNGAFTRVDIDKSFNISVEAADGSVRNVSQLSGGEEDMVAICLRLAISIMLADGTPSMLILDEVLTAMDSERAEAILETMQGLADGQIIIVAHNEVVKSIADKVVEL